VLGNSIRSAGARSIVNLTALFTGMVLALQLGATLLASGRRCSCRGSSACRWCGNGAVLTALMIGGRVGAGIAAELGSGRHRTGGRGQALGASPVRNLVVPRDRHPRMLPLTVISI
jgi:phospholipid/cholesterol/gamma-HCH transport system permease protein